LEVKLLEVFAEDSNLGIVRLPGRHYPGCVVQGDSLWILWSAARRIAEGVRSGMTGDDEFLGAVEELYNSLLSRLLHYQGVLQREGLDLPFARPVPEDFLRLTPEDEGPRP
jgi:hypothetical protein